MVYNHRIDKESIRVESVVFGVPRYLRYLKKVVLVIAARSTAAEIGRISEVSNWSMKYFIYLY